MTFRSQVAPFRSPGKEFLVRSKAQFMGHPLHPMLIPFPFAFLTGAVGFDVAGSWAGVLAWTTTGRFLLLLGIATGLVAAIPGAIDFLWVVPPNSSGKKRATLHLASNLSALALFAVALVLRPGEAAYPGGVALGFEVVALALVSTGGWLGGTLVYRNQIAVDHRYAGAGKWSEQTVTAQRGKSVVVADTDELAVNQMKLLHVNGQRVALGCTEDGYAAFDDRCTHRGGPLADGVLICGTVQCPWHGSQFDVHTGKVKQGPAKKNIKTHRVEADTREVRLTP